MALPVSPELQPVHSISAGSRYDKTQTERNGNGDPYIVYEFILRFGQALAAPFKAFAIDVFDAARDGQCGVMTGDKFPLQRFKGLGSTKLRILQSRCEVGPIAVNFVAQFVDVGGKFGRGKRFQFLQVALRQAFTRFQPVPLFVRGFRFGIQHQLVDVQAGKEDLGSQAAQRKLKTVIGDIDRGVFTEDSARFAHGNRARCGNEHQQHSEAHEQDQQNCVLHEAIV